MYFTFERVDGEAVLMLMDERIFALRSEVDAAIENHDEFAGDIAHGRLIDAEFQKRELGHE